MQRPSRKVWVLLCTVLIGCSLATDFDRDKIPEVGDDSGPGPGPGDAGGDSSMDARVDANLDAQLDGRAEAASDTGPMPDVPATQCTSNDQCSASQLCCNGLCVNTSVASRCTSCTEGCSAAAANSCNNRTCGCDNAAACGGATPYCVANMAGQSACSECADNTACAGRSDGKTQCILGRCAACNPTNNSGCSGATPICDGSSLTCVKCSMTPDNCEGALVCIASGACGGCVASSDCATPTTPICDTAAAATTCRACASDTECMGKSAARPYCNTDGSCGACKLVANVPDPGCEIASNTPACRVNNGQYVCMGCNSDTQCEVGGVRSRCRTGRCLECAPNTALLGNNEIACKNDSVKPSCDATTGLCQSCLLAGNTQMVRNAFCLGITPTRPYCDASGKCEACTATQGCSGNQPVCDGTSHQCRGCALGTEVADCTGATPACNATSGACVVCRQGAGAPNACTGTVNTTCSATNTCVDCIGNQGCATGEQCKATPTPECVACLMPSHCPAMNCKVAACSAAGACTYTNLVPPDDGVACTDEACVPGTGAITHTPNNAKCEIDGFSCTVSTCNMTTGCSTPEMPTHAMCPARDTLSCTAPTCIGVGGDANGCALTDTDTCTAPQTCQGTTPGACGP